MLLIIMEETRFYEYLLNIVDDIISHSRGCLFGWWKHCNPLKQGGKGEKTTAEVWCGDLHQSRKFLFFCNQQALRAKERLYIFVRMERGVNIAERASLAFRYRQKVEMK